VNEQARVICTLGRHTILALDDPEVEPGHQQIAVVPGDVEGAGILFTLTGNRDVVWGRVLPFRLPDGRFGLCVPHDAEADQRLMQLVDICADLRQGSGDVRARK